MGSRFRGNDKQWQLFQRCLNARDTAQIANACRSGFSRERLSPSYATSFAAEAAPTPRPDYQPMYWPPLADRLAPVIQLASSGMKKATA
jgi:hypothetical protein